MDSTTKGLIEAYLQKADQKLAVARRLLAASDYDDSISRAYYAAFHAVKALLVTVGQSPTTHYGAVTLFNLHFVRTARLAQEVGRFLTNLRDDRESADYELFGNADRSLAEKAVQEAERLVVEANAYLRREKLID